MNPVLRAIRWIVPGLGIKRWLLLALFGGVLFVNGIDRWLTDEGLQLHINEVLDNFVADFFPPEWLEYIFMALGIILIALGIRQFLYSILNALMPDRTRGIVDSLIEMRLTRGYKIVAVGGGTGLSTLLRGLKRYTANLTAIVTVTDDGGSSGRLQKELGILPPGDIRNCLVALADNETLVTDLFRYRFETGDGLSGHSFGNLFLAAMTAVTGNFDQAIRESSRVLNIKGRVLPATLAVARLCARLVDGTVVKGETNISKSTKPIEKIYLEPERADPVPDIITAIREADAIVLGPGSLYTSILPNLLVDRVAREIETCHAVKVYVCNVMTQPGETDSFTASQHIQALLLQSGARICDLAIINEEPPKKLLEAYAQGGQRPVVADTEAVTKLGVRPIRARVISESENVRHDPDKLAAVVVGLIDDAIAQRATFLKGPAPSPETRPANI
ncbi:MAG TPA: gluconeogenesis factor YvcK family protein [Candidatus Binatia bacterium]|nr:gluconeogenesis factor YvcK family protein [Candidatus Binatia bacterium]